MSTKFFIRFILLFIIVFNNSCVEEYEFLIDENLRDVAPFSVGVAIQTIDFNDYPTIEIVENEFNSITAGFEMKQDIIGRNPSYFNWTEADTIVEFAIQNGFRIHGHTLLWHSSVPYWVENFQGTDEEFEEIIKDYIQTVVSRYKGKVTSWDVVNEAFENNNGRLRTTVFRERLGDDYIEKCFKWAREADEDVLLFYNDFNLALSSSKMNAVIEMVEDFKSRSIPIDGVGMQMHIGLNLPTNNEVENAVEKLVETGLKIHFSEVDIRTNLLGIRNSLSDRRANQQAAKMQAITEIYNTIPANQQFGITIWGVTDDRSWLTDFYGSPQWPLLFNENYERKLAHQGFLKALY